MWHFQSRFKPNLNQQVQNWNQRLSDQYPHCSVCNYFKQNDSTSHSDNQIQLQIPVNSEVILSEKYFTKRSSHHKIPKLTELKKDKFDCLLKCKNCNLIVHQKCYHGNLPDYLIYGNETNEKSLINWLCDKCIWNSQYENKNQHNLNQIEPMCCLCLLRGGALKQTDDKQKWAHISCALFIKGVLFKSPETHAAIQVPSQLFKNEKKLNQACVYCSSFTQYQTHIPNGLTVKCSAHDCQDRFHVTCGNSFGKCVYEEADWPNGFFTYCHKHFNEMKTNKTKKNKNNNSNDKPFELNQTIPIKLDKCGSFITAKIVGIEPKTFFEVDFGDGTFSTDMHPSDLIVNILLY